MTKAAMSEARCLPIRLRTCLSFLTFTVKSQGKPPCLRLPSTDRSRPYARSVLLGASQTHSPLPSSLHSPVELHIGRPATLVACGGARSPCLPCAQVLREDPPSWAVLSREHPFKHSPAQGPELGSSESFILVATPRPSVFGSSL